MSWKQQEISLSSQMVINQCQQHLIVPQKNHIFFSELVKSLRAPVSSICTKRNSVKCGSFSRLVKEFAQAHWIGCKIPNKNITVFTLSITFDLTEHVHQFCRLNSFKMHFIFVIQSSLALFTCIGCDKARLFTKY